MPTPDAGQKLVLDTHVWIWLMEGAPALKPELLRQIEASAREGDLLVSAISVWEVGMLETKGRITFDQECSGWVKDALSAPGISLAPLDPEIAVASTRLPGGFHGDPADRILVATARFYASALVTADAAILDYAQSGNLSAVRA